MKSKTIFGIVLVFLLATVAAAQTKVSGTSLCAKPDPQHMIEVGDRPNHALEIGQSKCTWTKPMDIAGTQTKDDVVTEAAEMRGTRDRKSTRLNSSHLGISYAVFC